MTDLQAAAEPLLPRAPTMATLNGALSGPRGRLVQIGLIAALMAMNFALVKCQLLGDPDTHWHVAVGRWIVEHGDWPRVDLFSHTAAGQPWIAKEWLSQVVMYGAYAIAGWTGVALLGAACIGVSLGLLSAWLARSLQGLAVANLALLVFILASASLISRPHIIGLPLMVIWTLALIDAVDARRSPRWWLLAVMLLWANAHAGYTIGFLIAGLLAAEAVRDADKSQRSAMAVRWAAFLLLAFAVSCLTPYGYESLRVTQKLFAGTGREAIAHVTEWQPIELDLAGTVGLIGLPALLLGLLLQPRRNSIRIALVLILGWMMVRHQRFALLFAFTAVPIAMGSIAAGPFGRWIALKRQNIAPGRYGLTALFAVIGLTLAFLGSREAKTNSETTPAEALVAARRLGLTERKVYNTYNFGGYLISQGVPTFIDGRSDQLYLNGFLDTYIRTLKPGRAVELDALLKSHGIGWAILRTGDTEAVNFQTLGWKPRYQDSIATIWTPPQSSPDGAPDETGQHDRSNVSH